MSYNHNFFGQSNFGYQNPQYNQNSQYSQNPQNNQGQSSETALPPDHYQILGISKDANSDAIRKAYRKLSLKWHPDKNPDQKEVAETQFKLLSEAYQVLSDAKKRREYDTLGTANSANLPHSSHFQNFSPNFVDPFDLFRSFFSNMNTSGTYENQSFFDSHPFSGTFRRHPHHDPFSGFNSYPLFMSPMGMGHPFHHSHVNLHDPFSQSGSQMLRNMSFSSSSSSSSIPRHPSFSSRSVSTQIINGRRTTITKSTDFEGNVTKEVVDHEGNKTLFINGVQQCTRIQ